MKNKKHIMIFKTMNISLIYLKEREGKSRRDGTLLTVDFNLRKKTRHATSLQSTAGTTLCRRIQVSSLRDLGACVAHFVRRLSRPEIGLH